MISFAPLRVLPLFVAAVVVHAAEHLIAVGGLGPDGSPILAFNPPTVMAAQGDTLNFFFHQKNHSATQSSFSSPCSHLDGGFDSGFMPVAATATSGFPGFTVQVNDTKPIWVYCRQTGHCAKGMVFAANPPDTGNTFSAFQAAALASGNTSSVASSDAATAATATTAASVPVYTDSTTTMWVDPAAYTSPPPPVVETVTATVTVANSVYTTTYASWEGAPANPTPNAQPATHTVIVGGTAGLVYTPSNLTAQMGDSVVFEFHEKNHTVTQSSFNDPCKKLASGGFDSGFMPVSPNSTTFPTFTITINDTKPIWAYCRQTNHCVQGMVVGINTPTTGPNTFPAFVELAKHSNVTDAGNSSASGSNTAPNATHTSGVARAAVSVGLGMSVTGLVMAALL